MKCTFVELALHLAIVLPLILLTLTDRKRETLKILAVFALYFLKHGLIAILIILIVKGVFNFLYLSPTEWDLESLLFQATMPGLDEEIAFRGIMLGLLTKILKPARRPLFHPAIYVTALLFGMAHGLYLNDSFELSYNISSLLITALLGVAWAWMTLKSGSILLALVSHNLGNVASQVISMGK